MNFNENADLDRHLDAVDAWMDSDEMMREMFGDDYSILETEPEARRDVDYSDVDHPDEYVVWGYGGDHRVLIPSA